MILLILGWYYLLTSVLKCLNRECIGGKCQYLPQGWLTAFFVYNTFHCIVLYCIHCIVSEYQCLPSGRFILADDSYSETPKRLSLNIYTKNLCHIRHIPIKVYILYNTVWLSENTLSQVKTETETPKGLSLFIQSNYIPSV